MPVQITASLLGSINNSVNMAFNDQLYEAASVREAFTMDVSSAGAEEVYPRLDQLKGIREWIGDRQVQSLTESSFTIKNRKFEQTIELARTDIEDDKYGLFSVVAEEMGRTAKHFPDLLMASLISNGTATLGYDGQYFFSGGHLGYTRAGAVTTASNFGGGSGTAWYLIDTSRRLKPFIYQTRVPFGLTARFNPEDPAVFDRDAFIWGTRGRCNVGYGLWQLAYCSQQPFNMANVIAARTAMAGLLRPDGTPMGITPDTVVIGSSLYPLAKSFYEDGLIGSDPTTPTTLVANQVRGMLKPLEYKWIP